MPKRKKKKAPADPSRYATTSIPSRSGPANANAQVDGAAAVEQQRASDANGHGEEREEREEAESVMVPLDAEARARLEQKLLGMLQGKASLRKLQHTIQRLQHPNANCAWFRTSDQSSVELQGGGDGVRLCVGCGDGSYEMSMVLGGRWRADVLLVTFYESEAKLRQRYTNFAANALLLRALGAALHFEVDCKQLGALGLLTQPSRLLFVFPQCGTGFPGSERWHAEHRELLAGYFMSAAATLSKTAAGGGGGGGAAAMATGAGHEGEVELVLMDRAPYSELPLRELATAAGLMPLRTEVFEGGCCGLYRHRMTNYDRVVKCDEASTRHVFGLFCAS